MQTAVQADTETRFTVDVAVDGRTVRFNRGITYQEAGRGDTFVIFGPIYPAGTLPTGPASNSPDDPGSIGAWTFRDDIHLRWRGQPGEWAGGVLRPPAGGDTSTVDPSAERKAWGGRFVQPAWPRHSALPVRRWRNAGGRGPGQSADRVLSPWSAAWVLSAAPAVKSPAVAIGTNSTGFPNLRITFKLKKQAPK